MSTYIYDAVLTEEEEGGYSVEFPSLPGCYTCGDDLMDAISMAADAAKTWVASHVSRGESLPGYDPASAGDGAKVVSVVFDADPSWIVEGPVVSAAQAARILGVSAGRVTSMLDSGILDGYRQGRRTFITQASVDARLACPRPSGRPRSEALQA